ncbi:hypothetical protein [Rhodococcus erythropolis]
MFGQSRRQPPDRLRPLRCGTSEKFGAILQVPRRLAALRRLAQDTENKAF